MAETITSEHNPLLKDVRRAASKGALTAQGYALAEGFHLLEEAVQSQVEIGAVIASEEEAERAERLAQRSSGHRMITVPEKIFRSLSSTETPQGVVALVKLKETQLASLMSVQNALILVVDRVQDPGNAGAMVRAAEAFGATGVVFLKGSVHAYHPKCLRGSAGSIFRMPMAQADMEVVVRAAGENGIALFAAMPRANQDIETADFTVRCAVVIGSEGSGVSPEFSNTARGIRIPTTRVESLNAAVAAAVVLYEAQRQRKAQ